MGIVLGDEGGALPSTGEGVGMENANAVTSASARSWKRWLPRFSVSELIMPSFIVVYTIIITAIEPRFLSWGNLDNLASQLAPLFVMSVGQAFTIISGGLDLSMAAVMSISGIAGILSVKYVGVWGGIAVMAIVGIA